MGNLCQRAFEPDAWVNLSVTPTPPPMPWQPLLCLARSEQRPKFEFSCFVIPSIKAMGHQVLLSTMIWLGAETNALASTPWDAMQVPLTKRQEEDVSARDLTCNQLFTLKIVSLVIGAVSIASVLQASYWFARMRRGFRHE